MSGALFEAKNIEKSFISGRKKIRALSPISLQVFASDFLVITGPSGAGKSTLLNLLSGLDTPTRGDILFQGTSLVDTSESEIAKLRNISFGFIFQTPHLIPHKTILENVMIPFSYRDNYNPSIAKTRSLDLLSYVGLATLGDRYPSTLSGGEMQRVVYARALVCKPKVIFADEPTGSLDADNSKILLNLLQEQVTAGCTVIMVTHDPEAVTCGSRIVQLDKIASTTDHQ